jgi:hypothetical protein
VHNKEEKRTISKAKTKIRTKEEMTTEFCQKNKNKMITTF